MTVSSIDHERPHLTVLLRYIFLLTLPEQLRRQYKIVPRSEWDLYSSTIAENVLSDPS